MFIDHDNLGSSLEESCGLLRQHQFSVILDLSWGGWEAARRVAEEALAAKHLPAEALP